MRRLWTDDSEKIHAEVELLIQNKSTLFCMRHRKNEVRKLYVTGTTNSGGSELLVVNHPHEPSCDKPTCVFYYHLEDSPLRYFELTRVKKVDKYLGLEFPKEVFEIQRRRYPRVKTPHNSSANFSFQKKTSVYHAEVEDVSLGGVKLRTDIQSNSNISKGDIIAPLSLTLFQRFRTDEEIYFVIPEATVAWTATEGQRTVKIGLEFSLLGYTQKELSDYIDLRTLEDSPEDLNVTNEIQMVGDVGSPPPVPRFTHKIMIVDDEEASREILLGILPDKYECVTAQNAK